MPGQHHAAQPGDSALPIREELPTLADILRKTGYQTSAIVANHVYLNEIYGFDRGFEHFDRRPGGGVGEYVALAQVLGAPMRPGHLYYRDAKEITDDAVQWLEEERRAEHPFFLFLNYLDPHTPYLPPARFDSLFEDRTPVDPLHPMPEVWALLYDRELHYVDEQLGRLFDALRENDAFENTVVLVTSDHGEGLGEHGIPWHNWHLYDGLIRVPLIVKPVGLRRAELDKTPITSAGVFGLALRELGLEAPPSSATVLSEWYPHLPVTAEQKRWAARAGIDPEADRVAWLEDNRKFIVSSCGAVLAFDLSLDPNEEQPLTLSEEEATAARQRAEAWWNANPLPQDASPELDAEHIRNMRALGY